jgi:hypothetical protein
MPADQGLGLDEEPSQASMARQPAQSGDSARSGGRSTGRAILPPEHRNLVTKQDHLYGELSTVTSMKSEQLEDSDERQIEEGQRHDTVSR